MLRVQSFLKMWNSEETAVSHLSGCQIMPLDQKKFDFIFNFIKSLFPAITDCGFHLIISHFWDIMCMLWWQRVGAPQKERPFKCQHGHAPSKNLEVTYLRRVQGLQSITTGPQDHGPISPHSQCFPVLVHTWSSILITWSNLFAHTFIRQSLRG